MAEQLMEREQADFQREKADAAREAQLTAREMKLKSDENRVAQLQTTLISEQKRVWKQVKALQATGALGDRGKGSPRTAPKEALLQRTSQVKAQTTTTTTTT